MVSRRTCNLGFCFSFGDLGPDADCGKMFAFRTSARPFRGHVELEPKSSPSVASRRRWRHQRTLFLEVEEANRFLLLTAHCGFSSQRCQRSGSASYVCVDARCARHIRAFRPIRHADIGASQAHDATLRVVCSSNRRYPTRKWLTRFTCRGSVRRNRCA